MTWPEVDELFDYWREFPPMHELMAMSVGYEKPKTLEERWAEGVMGPEDLVAWSKMTGGKIKGMGHG